MTEAPQDHLDGPQDHSDRWSLTALIEESAPRTPLSDAVSDDALHEMVRSAGWEARRIQRRTTPRAAAIATVLALGLGGAGVAAAAALTDWKAWMPWVENPDAAVHFTLPSGKACEYRMIVRAGDPADISVLQDVLRTTDVLAVADIDGELARIIAGDHVFHENGVDTVVPATELWSEDEIYEQGVTGAINNVIWDEMAARGITDSDGRSELSYRGQSDCAGMQHQ